MSEDWARRFKLFALAVDYVDEDIIDEIKDVLGRYFERTLDACFFRFLIEGPGTETPEGVLPTLETVWTSSIHKAEDVAIFSAGGRSGSLVALCHQRRKPLWVVAEDGRPLLDNPSLVDRWSRLTNLPPYEDYGGGDARTAIMMPLRYGDLLFGVMDLEFKELLAHSRKGTQVMTLVADAIGRLIWLRTMTQRLREDTREAFSELQRRYHDGVSPLRRHTVFVASSSRADPQVMQAVLTALAEFRDILDVHFWKSEASSGSIAGQVRGAIADSEFGICYISEPSNGHGDGYRFFDNPNVLFEAGMLQMLHELRDDRSEVVSRWIPIREGPHVAPPLPFDFAGDRVIHVPRRDPAGPPDEAALAEMLKTAIAQVIEDLEIG